MTHQYQFFELDIPTWSNDLDHLETSITNDNTHDNNASLAEYQLNSTFHSALSSTNSTTVSSISSASSYSDSLMSNNGNYNYHYSHDDSLYPLKAVFNDIPVFNGSSNESHNPNSVEESNTLQLSSPLSSCVSPTLTGVKMQNLQEDHNNPMTYQMQERISSSAVSPLDSRDDYVLSSNVNQNEKQNDERNESHHQKINDSIITPPPTATKRTKSGRVKKPMTLVQRKAHNKIERKYRININSKIANLQKLVPWMSEDGVAFEVDSKHLTEDISEIQMQSNKKLNKSMILDMVTEYILLLKDECKKKDDEIKLLKESSSS